METNLLILITGVICIVTFITGYLLAKSQGSKSNSSRILGLEKQVSDFNAQLSAQKEKNAEAQKEVRDKEREISELRQKNRGLEIEKSTLNNDLEHAIENNKIRKAETDELFAKMKIEFEALAGKALKSNSEVFADNNRKVMHDILNPFKSKLDGFEKTVKDIYLDETKERSKMGEQIKHLMDLNQTISQEAHNLTKALKGDNKIQGNWGELVLERVLESSGLKKGEEFYVQYTDKKDGTDRKPDVVVNLPDGKNIIIDSKVSLIAYENYVNGEEDQRDVNLKAHITSVKTHIKSLSEKKYQISEKLDSPDFILMFIPIEPGFSLALQGDHSLYQYALNKNIVLVSPTTLLATLRTVASIWKQEKQTLNAFLIAEKAGKLYDKFVGFIEDFEKIGAQLATTNKTYHSAFNKLKDGQGNIVNKTEELKKLGAKTTKHIPDHLLGNDEEGPSEFDT